MPLQKQILDYIVATAKAREASGRIDEAAALWRRIIQMRPDHAGSHAKLGALLARGGDGPEAVAAYRRALAVTPAFPEALYNMGWVLVALGRMAEAETAYARAARTAPGWQVPVAQLRRMASRRIRPDPDALARALAAESNPESRAVLGFGLGLALEDEGRFEDAFAAFSAANRERRAVIGYDPAEITDLVTALIAIHTPAFQADGISDEPAAPIFILGLPRSGSTLVEQILAGHPDIASCGEITDFPDLAVHGSARLAGHPYPDALARLDGTARHDLARLYLDGLRQRAGDRPRATDKTLFNFLHIGLIARLLPRARIIHCVRDPLDLGLSIFRMDFGTGMRFAYDLGEIGHYQRQHDRLMAHWRGLLPGMIHEVCLETLIGDPGGEIRRLLDFCGLSWNDACRDFTATERPIATTSALQVRRPLNTDGVGRWRHYQPWLGPLRTALGA